MLFLARRRGSPGNKEVAFSPFFAPGALCRFSVGFVARTIAFCLPDALAGFAKERQERMGSIKS